jgi:hypothetical protein
MLASAAFLMSAAVPAGAVAAAELSYPFELSTGSLGSALSAYARITGRQLLYPSTLVAGRQAPAVKGRLTADQALARLLAGSGIGIRHAGRNVYVLTAAPASAPATPRGAAAPAVARSSPQRPPAASPSPAAPARAPVQAPKDEEQEVFVTGSYIRGAGEKASQVLVVGRDDIERSGYGTVAKRWPRCPRISAAPRPRMRA